MPVLWSTRRTHGKKKQKNGTFSEMENLSVKRFLKDIKYLAVVALAKLHFRFI
jgi:hypothetical protein